MTYYRLASLERIGVWAKESEQPPAIRGEHMEMGYYRYPAGTKKPPHVHPEEQMVAVIRGKLGYSVAGDMRVLGPGEAVYIPANVEHENWSVDGEVEFVSCKNLL